MYGKEAFSKMAENLPNETKVKQPDHLRVAEEMANTLITSFNPDLQNEALELIHSVIKENRQRMVANIEKEFAWLKETLEKL